MRCNWFQTWKTYLKSNLNCLPTRLVFRSPLTLQFVNNPFFGFLPCFPRSCDFLNTPIPSILCSSSFTYVLPPIATIYLLLLSPDRLLHSMHSGALLSSSTNPSVNIQRINTFKHHFTDHQHLWKRLHSH